MHRIQLTTFLKLLALPTNEKTRSYMRYEDAGGYDFYNSLKRVARDVTSGRSSASTALKKLETISNPVARQHNADAAIALFARLEKTAAEYFEPPKGLFKSASGALHVQLVPEIGRIIKGKREVIALWATKEPILPRTIAGVGVHLLQSHLKKGGQADCEFYIFDLVQGKMYGAANVPNQADKLLAAECAIADTFLLDDDAA